MQMRLGALSSATLLLCISIIVNKYLFPTPRPYAFPLAYITPFAVGVLTARLVKKEPPQASRTASHFVSRAIARHGNVLTDTTLVVIVILAWFNLGQHSAPAIGAYLGIMTASGCGGWTTKLIAKRPTLLLSSCTLEVYLFQAPVWAVLAYCFDAPIYFMPRDALWPGYSGKLFVGYVLVLYAFAGTYALQRDKMEHFVSECLHSLLTNWGGAREGGEVLL